MSNPAPPPHDPASSTTDEAPDPSVLRAERRLRLLEELTEIGMELARALKPAAEAREEPSDDKAQAKGRDPADAFSRVSRAVRLTLALEAKTDEQLRDLKAGVSRVREEARAEAAERAEIAATADREARPDRIREVVTSLAEAEIEDFDERETLCEALEERLAEDEAYIFCDERPLRETVERLCKDLMLTPDPSRWDGDEWIDHDPTSRSRFSPFREPSRGPVLNGHGAPPTPVSSRPLQAVHNLE
jgi:hypothetical protein